jgi:CDP-paratose 2-epimerase
LGATRNVLITGGAGFIGSNTARHFAAKGWRVVVLDDLSRRGSSNNLDWLRSKVEVEFVRCDVRDAGRLEQVLRDLRPEAALHLAGQVAVTTSVADPRVDFEINAIGTFNLLEAVRRASPDTVVVNASTNKVYGKLESLGVALRGERWELSDLPRGVDESQPLDFHSPYGCSKGAADQYVVDYGRIFGLRTITLRQSCIYGTRQMGVEDQGWVAWFTIAAVLGRAVTVYGDGRQIRDVLWIDDLVELYGRAIDAARDGVSGAFNVGGGPERTLSLRELIARLEELTGRPLEHRLEEWRPGDQRAFVCDIGRAERELDWRPRTMIDEGLALLTEWVESERETFARMYGG